VSLPEIAPRFLPEDSGVRFLDGFLDLKTQMTCRQEWLTASHLVEIKNFKLEVAEGRKRLMGVPVKRLRDVLDVEYFSFVVPMNGSLRDPHVGVAASLEQVLFKILEARFQDKSDRERWAQWGAVRLGRKIDKALKGWLAEKRKEVRGK
jgi:hypothetical protein